ncbi:MAG: dipeptide epimerase [Propionibacteriaceae bacterium]|nr:dipeptide epimerase [Propionibacteriaceae bacterium]
MTSIVSLTTYPVSLPLLRPFVTAVRRAETIDVMMVEVRDAAGRVGLGEAVTGVVTGETAQSVRAAIDGPLATRVVGREPDDLCAAGQLRAVAPGAAAARSGVDCAVHDLVAQARGVTMAALLGATTHRVRTDMSLSADEPAAMASLAEGYVNQGFDTLKLKVDQHHDALAVISAVRAAVGPQVALRVDANQAWTPAQAIAFIRACEDGGYALEFVEQPVAAADITGLAAVRAATSTPIMADESAKTAADVARVIEAGAADLISVKLAKCGGLAEAKAIIGRVHAAGLGVIIGCMMESPVGVAAAAALAAATAPGQTHDLDAPLWLAPSVQAEFAGQARFSGPNIDLDGRACIQA